jgi:hypothetical protein
VPEDQASYGEFCDWGHWSGTSWRGHTDLPPGYWVYVAPHWYIFGQAKGDPVLPAPPKSPAVKRSWGPEQATGRPDTDRAGDVPTAWASKTADGQDEWLRLHYADAVVPAAVHVYETYNPGALRRITARRPDGREVPLFSGDDPVDVGSGKGVAAIAVQADFATNCITLHLASKEVPGWNEIDAVALLDNSEREHWAVAAEASSTWASRYTPAPVVQINPATNRLRIEQLETQVQQLRAEVEQLRKGLRRRTPDPME